MVVFPVLVVTACRTLIKSYEHYGNFTVFDLITLTYSPKALYLWVLAPLATMVFLNFIWRRKANYNYVVRMGKRIRVGRDRVIDVLLVSIATALVLHVAELIVGYIMLEGNIDLSVPSHPLLVFAKDHVSEYPTNFGFAALVAFVYCLLVLMVENMAFLLLHTVTKTWIAIALLTFLNLPATHASQTFVHELIAFGGDVLAINPLNGVYESFSIYYDSWGSVLSHHFFIPVLFIIVTALGSILLLLQKNFLKC